jgi:hypothetical protein
MAIHTLVATTMGQYLDKAIDDRVWEHFCTYHFGGIANLFVLAEPDIIGFLTDQQEAATKTITEDMT